MIEAVVFDMDGLLLDTEAYWDAARHDFVAAHGGDWGAADQVAVMGMNSFEWARYLQRRFGITLPEAAIIASVTERMTDRYRTRGAPLLPGAVAAVVALAARLPLAVASSSPRALIEVGLTAAGLRPHFQAIVSSDEVPRGKPDPAVYREAARRLAVAPSACLAFEDSSNGLLSARAAGMTVIAVPNRAFPPTAAALAGAAQVLPALTALDLATLGLPARRAQG